MPINGKSKLSELMTNPEAVEILKKYMKTFDPNSPHMKMALGMSVKAIISAGPSGVSVEDRKAILKELEEANLEPLG
jgi:hypothetical protein